MCAREGAGTDGTDTNGYGGSGWRAGGSMGVVVKTLGRQSAEEVEGMVG